MTDDPRCCGSGACIVDAQGHCWCGQQWDGEKMCHPPLAMPAARERAAGTSASPQADTDQDGRPAP